MPGGSSLKHGYFGQEVKGTTINDLGVGPEEIEKKKIVGARPGKNKFQKAFLRKK